MTISAFKDFSLGETVKRFPFAIACSFLFTILTLSQAENHNSDYLGLLILCATGCFGFIAARLFYERLFFENSRFQAFEIYLATAIIIAIPSIVIFLSPHAHYGQLLLCFVAFMAMFIAPYLAKPNNSTNWTFAFRLNNRITLTFFVALITYLGIVTILASIDFLFKANFGDLYLYSWIIITCFAAPLFAMAGIPRKFDVKIDEYNKLWRLLLCNVILPLWLIYAAVLYAYIAKILFNFMLPDGGVALMVSLFGASGIVIYLAVFPIAQNNSGLQVWFVRNLPKILIAPLILLAIAISKRIFDYGITEDRYLVVAGTCWLIFALFNIKSAQSVSLRNIIGSLVIASFIVSFGPWGVEQVSINSQFSRLQNILEKNEMLKVGKIVKAKNYIKFSERKSISSIVDYLGDRDREKLLHLFADFLDNLGNDRNFDSSKALKLVGIEYVQRWDRHNEDWIPNSSTATVAAKKYIYYDHPQTTIKISGYDYMGEFDIHSKSRINEIKFSETKSLHVSFDGKSQYIFSKLGQKDEITIDLDKVIKQKAWQEKEPEDINQEEFLVEGETQDFKIKIIVKELTLDFNNDTPTINNLTANILVKFKN